MRNPFPPAPVPAPVPGDANISDEAVEAATGRRWGDWFAVLDDLGGKDHRDRAKRLGAAHPGLSGWWVQMVTVQYERARGLRVEGQKSDGGHRCSVQRTVPVGVEAAWAALVGADWLPGAVWEAGASFPMGAGGTVEVRIVDPCRQLRFWWHHDGGRSTVVASLVPGAGKTAVRFTHEGQGKEEVEEARGRWTRAVERVAEAATAQT